MSSYVVDRPWDSRQGGTYCLVTTLQVHILHVPSVTPNLHAKELVTLQPGQSARCKVTAARTQGQMNSS